MTRGTPTTALSLRATMGAAVLGLLMGGVGAPQVHARQEGELLAAPIRGNVFVVMGGGGHVTVSAGVDGLLLVDTGSAAMADKMLAKVVEIGTNVAASASRMVTCVGPTCWMPGTSGPMTPYGFASPAYNGIIASPQPLKPLRWIIQSSADPDHVGGTAKLGPAGRSFAGGNLTTILGDANATEGAILMAHENVLRRMTAENFPEAAWPLETYYQPNYKISHHVNGEGVQLFHAPAAITDADTFVHFRYSDVIHAGDLYTPDRYPMIDLEHGGTVEGVINGLNQILDVALPEFRHQGGTMVVPGHGRIGDSADVAIYRNMVSIVRDRVQELIKEGKTLAEIKAMRPTLDYDGIYGSPDKFIDAIHSNLTSPKAGTGSR